MKEQHKTTIKEDMSIYNAATQKKALLKALGGCKELDIDLSHVSEIDTAGFQILLLTKREAIKTGKVVRLTGHSKAVTELIDLYGMAAYFGDQMVIPAEERAAAKQ